jgi:flavodoxin
MRALVVFESMFGNTRRIAEAVAEGLAGVAQVDLREVSAAPSRVEDDVDLLVVGGPTHAFGMSRPATRRKAAEEAGHDLVSTGDGIREWLVESRIAPGVPVATFDTRIRTIWVPGSAAKAARKQAQRLGCDVSPGARTFYVQGTQGPLDAGEPERARAWGQELARSAARSVS